MKGLSSWIARKSLSQQLFTLVLLFTVFFSLFYFVYVGGSVSQYTDAQMYRTLEQYQNNLELFYSSTDRINLSDLVLDNNQDILTSYYYREGETFVEMVSNASIAPELSQELQLNVSRYSRYEENASELVSREYHYTKDGTYTYYIIGKLSDDLYVVNLLDNSYAVRFRNELLGSVIDVTAFVIGFFFLILMIWVSQIIRPLNQIRIYIDKVKNGEAAELKIAREDEIGEVANALVNMREELIRQEKIKEEMIHNISHDLKTPIATIKSYGESIQDGIYPYGTLESSVDVIIDNAERLDKKVHSLLFLNRVEYLITSEENNTTCDMRAIIRTIITNIKMIRPEIDIETNLQESYFKGSEEAWRVAVENILENALRYANTQIVVTLDKEQLCIFNDGPQFNEAELQSMFKAYEKGNGGQFGLGLSIVNKVVQTNGCRVSAENVEFGGVIFKIVKCA